MRSPSFGPRYAGNTAFREFRQFGRGKGSVKSVGCKSSWERLAISSRDTVPPAKKTTQFQFTSMSTQANPSSHAIDRGAPILEPPQDELGILANLCWHSLFVLDPDFERIGGSPPVRPVMPVARGKAGSPPREQAHVDALVSALKLLNPVAARRMRPSLETPAQAYDFSRLFRAELGALKFSTDVRAPVIRSHLRAILEESLVRWPSAYSRFCREIAAVETDLPRLLTLLARAAGHAATADEFRHVERAQAEVIERLRSRLPALLPLPMRPDTPVVTTIPSSAVLPSPAPVARCLHLTHRQGQILEHCVSLAELFFRYRTDSPGLIEPRLFPLICAPTGSGKSMLVATLAARLDIHYLRIQRGDMAPQGASRMRATVSTILDALVRHDKLLLHIDELDKLTVENGAPTPTNEWGAGIFSDVWSLLDGVLPFSNYLATDDRVKPPGVEVTAELLKRRTRCGLWVVGSGTWQSIFSRGRKSPMGFSGAAASTGPDIDSADIAAAQLISPELLARFNADIQVMAYPDQDEIQALLAATGILKLAKDCDYTISVNDLDFARGGFRVLETLYSRLLLRQAKMSPRPAPGAGRTGAPAISSDPPGLTKP